ncbi:unnamed protein product [Bursaphelenchus okinawaensis]|uniref:Exonuclease 1 n=1 Tax=Bursaphelenchus okinawaensis TaxID=465554 RepID=A0A811KFI3_9BILA|nr:unnamed protein product [Bursaphelenchus okinawaensis]CAG9103562.1 unnamed protein product [Bursaphelenchus okinawaensis]
MGVKQLLPFVEKACRPCHVEEFAGKRIGIDVSCLLHRGVFGCVEMIAKGLKTNFCIKYVEKYLKVLFHYEMEVYLIFDGKSLGAKQLVNSERKEKRQSNQRMGDELMAVGLEEEAYKVFRQGIGVPKEIQDEAIRHFKEHNNVKVIISPHESDAQLAFMIQNDIVDLVVTEDSDLIVFGASKILFKLKENGTGTLFEQEKLPRCMCLSLSKNFKMETFRRMCIMSGCDYLPSGLNGVGLKKAESLLSRTCITDMKLLLPKAPMYLNNRSLKITPDLIQKFIQAENTFIYQIVYDPVNKCQRPINLYPNTEIADYIEYTDKVKELSSQYAYAGTILPPSEAVKAANGDLIPEADDTTTTDSQVLKSVQNNIEMKSQSPNLVSPRVSALRASLSRSKSQPSLKASPLLNMKRQRPTGMFSPKVTKRRITVDEKGGITFNVTGPLEDKSATCGSTEAKVSTTIMETKKKVVVDETIDLSKVNAKKIINPLSSVSYTKVQITNVKVNRQFVSPLIRRPFAPVDSMKPAATHPTFL